MHPRRALVRRTTVLVAAIALTSACGDGASDPVGQDGATGTGTATTATTGGTAPGTTPSPGTTEGTVGEETVPGTDDDPDPDGPDDVVLEYDVSGGFTTAQTAFRQPPRLVVSSDGRAFTVGPVAAVFPGPLLPNVQVRTISEEGIEQLLAAAEEAGLLADVDYEEPTNIADAPTTTLTIDADGETWVHSAYALAVDGGLEPGAGESSPEREQLADFLATVTDLTTVVDPAELGEEEPFVPDEYLVMAEPVEDVEAFAVEGIEPRVVDWPARATSLAEIGSCAAIDAGDDVTAVFVDADELTFFAEGDVVHQVTPKPVYPGISCPT